ncbi:hypothetical protein EDD11_003591 [Mortierella claussenii]|nr:hypothetical protein EDD11_003591 [Mortierella claussenii]
MKSLPGHVTIRQEVGRDEDAVLNVISFKLQGNIDRLEEVAALEGVIGIYPVDNADAKEAQSVANGRSDSHKAHLWFAHELTGVAMVHQK